MELKMNNINPFKGNSVVIIAPGSEIGSLMDNILSETLICVVGDWAKLKSILIPKVISRIDFCYPGPSLVIKMNYYGFESSWFPRIRTQNHPRIIIGEKFKSQTSFYNFDFDWYCNKVGCNLTTGMAAIIDVMIGGAKSISLHGFNFYQNEIPYIKGYASKFDTRVITATQGNISGHNQQLLLAYFIEHIYPNVTVDENLEKIVQSLS